jgi:hypothetical protein
VSEGRPARRKFRIKVAEFDCARKIFEFKTLFNSNRISWKKSLQWVKCCVVSQRLAHSGNSNTNRLSDHYCFSPSVTGITIKQRRVETKMFWCTFSSLSLSLSSARLQQRRSKLTKAIDSHRSPDVPTNPRYRNKEAKSRTAGQFFHSPTPDASVKRELKKA